MYILWFWCIRVFVSLVLFTFTQTHLGSPISWVGGVTVAANGYLTFFRAEEVGGGEEDEWHPTSVTPLPI